MHFCQPLQVIALQGVFHCAGQTGPHVRQKLLPHLQVGGRWRRRNQFAIRAPGDTFAVQVGDMTAQQAGGGAGGLVLPLPVADVEGHADGGLPLIHCIEEPLQRFDASALGGLVIFHQQVDRLLLEAGGQGV